MAYIKVLSQHLTAITGEKLKTLIKEFISEHDKPMECTRTVVV
jgi:hypothetical protein